MKINFLVFSALFVMLTTACASSKTVGATGTAGKVTDIEYRLPELKFEIKAEYQLRACGVREYQGNIQSFLKVKQKADLTTKYVATDGAYTFSPSDTSSLQKRSDHEFTLSLRNNGTLESLNSAVTDKTGSIIGNTIKFFSNVLTLGFAAFADAEGSEGSTPVSPCTDEIVKHLSTAHGYASAIEKHEDTLISLLTKNSISEDEGKQIARIQAAITALKEKLTAHRMENLTLKHTFTIEPEALEASNLLVIPNDKLKKWITKDDAALLSSTLFELALTGKPSSEPAIATPESTSIVVRKPALSTYRLCRGLCSADIEEMARGQVQVPQWGDMQLVNFKVKAFEKRTVNMSFNEAGAVTKLTWSKPSRTDAAMSSLAGASESAVGLLDVAQYGKELAETRALKVETDLVSQRNALREAKNKQDVLFSTVEVEEPEPELDTIRVILVSGEDP